MSKNSEINYLKKEFIILLKSLLLFLFISFSHLTKVFQDSFDYE